MRVCRPTLLSALLCSAWLSGCVSTISGSATPAPDLKSTPPDSTAEQMRANDLPTLLLSESEVNTIMDTAGMTVSENYDQPTVDDHPPSKPNCVGAVYPNAAVTYRGSGFLKTSGQVLNGPPEDEEVRHFVVQAAAIYPSEDRARGFVESSHRQWSDCAGQNLTYTFAEGTVEDWTIGTPTSSDGIVSMIDFQEGGSGWSCARSMTSRSNVVVDISACGRDVSVDNSVALATKIRDRIRP